MSGPFFGRRLLVELRNLGSSRRWRGCCACGRTRSRSRVRSRATAPGAASSPGAGGSVGFADPESRVGFGYVMNRTGPHILLDPRAMTLINATYAALRERPQTASWVES